jgi:oxazoline/thiazoline synthase
VQRLLFIPAEIDTECGQFAARFCKLLPTIPETLTILFALDLRSPELHHLSRLPTPLLLVSASLGKVYIGPCSIPGDSVCLSCLLHWTRTAGFDRKPEPAPASEEAELTAALVGHAVEQFRETGRIPHLSRALAEVKTATGSHALHPIFPLKSCPTCGALPEPTQRDLQMHVSPLTGIVRSMQTTTNLAAGSFRAMAKWVSPRPVKGARPPLAIQESHGRGVTREQAQLGCIGEALERYSLIYRGDEPLVRACMCELPALDPRSILLYSEHQYATREEWNRHADERYFVGEPFSPDQPIDWIAGFDLHTRETVYVPAACCLMWYQFRPGEPEYAKADTVGCGSGRTLADALSHALLEWIERDAMAIWWYNRLCRPALRLDSFDDERLVAVQEGLRRLGRRLILLDVTTDVGIPTYISVACRDDGSEPLFAGASHPSPRTAAWKAASEVGQIWFTAMQEQAIDAEFGKWIAHATLESQPYLGPASVIEAPPEPAPITIDEQLNLIVSRLVDAGLKPVAVDLSRPDVSLKTVRAVVPGLCHIWNRRAAGRLYQVPVRLGWRETPLLEEELNSICCMI